MILSVEAALATPFKASGMVLVVVVPLTSTMVAPFKALENMETSLELYSHVGIIGKLNSIKKDSSFASLSFNGTFLAVRIPDWVENSTVSEEPTKPFEKRM